MKSITPLAELIRQSSELMDESVKLKERARDTISKSTIVIDRSRELLFSGLVSRTPSLGRELKQNAIPASPADWSETPKPSAPSVHSPEQVVDRDFVDETVILDGRHFINCTVKNCILEYHGGPLMLESTNFTGCRFRFGNEAAMTVAMLQCFGLMGEPDSETVLPARPAQKTSSRVN